MAKLKTKKEVIRVAGRLREIVTVLDEKGNLLHKIINPLMVEFHPRDVVQVIVGASLLAIPVAFTEETWKLGENLPLTNVLLIGLLSLVFIGVFVFYNYYKNHIKEHWDEFLKRVLTTYFLSLITVSLILTLIQIAPWTTDWVLAVKRMILVAFPASMSAAVADMIK